MTPSVHGVYDYVSTESCYTKCDIIAAGQETCGAFWPCESDCVVNPIKRAPGATNQVFVYRRHSNHTALRDGKLFGPCGDMHGT